jgi:hypothetical protein
MKNEKYPPDWRNKSSYKHLKTHSLSQWAWEFLRRNPAYIKDWSQMQDKDEMKLAFKWGLAGLPKDPAKIYKGIEQDPDGIGFDPPGGFETLTLGKTKEEKEHLFGGLPNFKTGEQNFQFNFFLPINPQLKIAKKMLLKLQKRAGGRRAFKPRPDEWVILLRVLDAKAEGIRDKEIAEVLFSNQQSKDIDAGIKKVFDKYKQAQKYTEYDYRLIPYSEI